MNIGLTQTATASRDDLPGIVSQQQQRKAFGKAKRHSWAVKFLKLFLPLLSLGIFGLYFLPDVNRIPTPKGPVDIDGIDLSSKGLKMINPRYAGGNKKLGQYKIEAEYALQKITATHILELHKIKGHIQQAEGKWLKLSSDMGIYDTEKEKLDLSGNILITTNQGMQARLQSADINMKKQQILTDKPVEMRLNGNIINAATMKLSIAQKRVLFGGGVKVKLIKSKSMTQ